MADNGVHPDVVTKLWQVYSKPASSRAHSAPCLLCETDTWRVELTRAATEQEIPKQQRQGAIIILGMLALARRDVVTEKVDSLLKIGLGQHGMVCLLR